jgi:hypothetical protein
MSAPPRRAPIFSVLGLVVILTSIGWAVWMMMSWKALSTGGYAGADASFLGDAAFLSLAVLVIALPLTVLLGLVGLLRHERPRALCWLAIALGALSILSMLIMIVVNR